MRAGTQADIAVIGGSGLYDMDGLKRVRSVRVNTPFGKPSDAIVLGELAGKRLAFLSRHGKGHRIRPSAINYRANVYALKSLGVERIISVSAVGSMREQIKPGHLVLPDQFIDRTRLREGTFFDQGLVAHVAMADPICSDLSSALYQSAKRQKASVHVGGTYVCIEGPQFSTKAESNLYRSWGVDVIGMTNMPEAKLAREAEMCYATIALATDYDCWHESEESVTVEAILRIMRHNVLLAKQVIRDVLEQPLAPRSCGCASALANAIVTPPEAISTAVRKRYKLLLTGMFSSSQTRRRSHG